MRYWLPGQAFHWLITVAVMLLQHKTYYYQFIYRVQETPAGITARSRKSVIIWGQTVIVKQTVIMKR